MPLLTNHMKFLLQEAEVEHGYRRRNKHLDDPKLNKNFDYGPDPKAKKRALIIDDTKEYFDYYSNLDTGTKYRHLQFQTKGFQRRNRQPRNLNHIVDLDCRAYQKVIFNRFLKEVLASNTFRFLILILIIFNAALIGFNTVALYSENHEAFFEIIDQVLLAVFIFEIFLKWVYDFRGFWIIWWNVLDFIIMFIILYATITPTFLDSRSIIVLVRVGRALRSLRSLSWLSSLNVVSHTIFKSVIDMFNILFVLIIVMVVMAIAGVVLFDDEKLNTAMFLSALDAWFVLFICLTQDGWIEVLDSFRQLKSFFFIISLYLIAGVTICAFIFANLIVAVVVANLESSIRTLKAEAVKHENPLVRYDEFSSDYVEILPTHRALQNDKEAIFGQRPLSKPKLNVLSYRKLMCYIGLNVALEQNLLEYSGIEHDLIRLLSVILNIAKQMEAQAEEITDEQRKQRMEQARKTYYSEAQAQAKTAASPETINKQTKK